MTTTLLPAPPAPTLPTLTRVELRKSRDTRAGFWLLLTLGVAALAVPLLTMFFADPRAKTFTEYLTLAQFPVSLLLPVLGILLVTSEWSQRTAMTTFALVPQRARVVVAKLLAAALLALLGVVATLVAAGLVTALTPVLTDDATSWEVTAQHVLQVVALEVLYVLVGVAFGLLLRTSPLAIVLYFVVPTIVTVLVTTIPALDWVREWLDLTTTTEPMYSGDLDGAGWARAGTATVLWFVAPLIGGWVRLQRSEIA
ncbi:ABC transporter permease [Blastococcus sp. TF02A-35]|uniref:ABC transporter permease n=1 Tax=Blastococcus sp. TF02A-35 TaxID=2559612 RepID=UPI0010741619|nr:ABC transporter permease [Blastococcus sp. TF02A_35]TFV51606.1 ABC transporter permease [Blastococcus sp. TF02A_35]